MKELPKAYNPKIVEDKIYQLWENSGFFNPDNLTGKRTKAFSISLPPPNVTGKLHIGHSAMLAYQDIMIRFHRLLGDKTLWLPGMDHAAIATQNAVEKELKKEGKTRHDLGRKKFLIRVDDFVEKSKDTIRKQIKAMGASLDWSREQFTLSPELTKTVRIAFKKMYDDGLIYRGDRVVNWCPHCRSTLADDEVEYKEEQGKLYYLKYGPVTIATTRPETKLGDTGLAVNPKDKRYQKLIGKKLDIDLAGHKIKVKVFSDQVVDMEFGTGAIGVTPAHSLQDYQWAQKHDLEIIKVINEQGKMTKATGKYASLDVLTARKKLVEDLTKAGLIIKIENYTNNLSICYRCDTPVEPLPSKQWFVNVNKKTFRGKSLKQMANETVRSGQIKMIPDRFTKTYFQWMDNLRDWCISRQIWYGHQIPVWYKKNKLVRITYFVHGTTTDNEKGLASGHASVSLSQLGIKQTENLKNHVQKEKFDAVFCSDLKRAVQTTQIVFGKKIIKDKRLREINYGNLTQKETGVVYKQKLDRINNPFSKGESYLDVEKRVKNFLNEIIIKYAGKKIAIVSHQAPQLALEVLLNGKNWKQSFAEDWRNHDAWQPGWKYLVGEKESIQVSIDKPEGKKWQQDPDTLDTWFSSGLWTFSTLGWPEKTKDLKDFHPTSVMETGYDLIFFWVARMIMMSTYLLKEIPFKTVYFHGLVKTKTGEKMSKSKPENCIDPLDMIERFGADALRLSMVIGTSPGNDTRLYQEKIAGFRNFVNKLWNISRFILSTVKKIELSTLTPKPSTLSDKWILEELEITTKLVTDKINSFEFSQAGGELRHFTWDKLADWYLEIAKIEKNKDEFLLWILKKVLILWHPFIPFVTEEIWQTMSNGRQKPLMVEQWPKAKKTKTNKSVKDFLLIQKIITAIRNFRAEYHIPLIKKMLICPMKKCPLIEKEKTIIEQLAKVELIDKKTIKGVTLTVGQFDFIIPLAELINLKKEKEKTENELKLNGNLYSKLKERLQNKQFLKKAPREIIEREKVKEKELKVIIQKLKEKINNLQ